MKKAFFVLALLSFLIPISSFLIPSPVRAAEDPSNINITKRRPDRSADYSPLPSPQEVSPKSAEVKQVETTSESALARLWGKIKSFFQSLFKQPEASSTTLN
jgi:hypothetical protein